MLTVRVPADTPSDEPLYLAGSFNGWNAAHPPSKLKPREDGLFECPLPADLHDLEFKITRGSWDTVECTRDGRSVNNRVLRFNAAQELPIVEVGGWCDLCPESVHWKRQHSVVGDLRVIKDVFSPQLGNIRDVLVWLPPGYETSNERYPVVYMHDGQNLFDDVTAFDREWGVDEVSTELSRLGFQHIVVGIPNIGVGRIHEYSPWVDDFRRSRGYGERYMRFILQTVKPFVDRQYRTKPEREFTAICGSSLGGLISLYAGITRSDIFSFAACLSPTMNVAGGRILKLAQSFHGDVRFWLDYGEREFGGNKELSNQMIESVRECAEFLSRNGAPVRCVFDPEGEHNETSWRRRLPDIFQWWHDSLPK